MFRRRSKSMDELYDDPAFAARSLLLAGGVEMAAIPMMRHADPQIQELGRKLASRASWFFVDEQVDVSRSTVSDSEQDTMIIKPPRPPDDPSNRGG